MPSRKLRDSAVADGGRRWGRGRGRRRERGSPKPGRFGPGTHPVPRRPPGQHSGQPRSLWPRAMVTVRAPPGDQLPARRLGAAAALRGCRRGSRNMRDACSPRQATSWQCPAHIPKSALRKKKETMNTTDTTAGRGLEALRAAIVGQVFVPGEAGYDQARQAWNLAVDQRPAVVVETGSAADVARAVRFARGHGMRIAPQGTGHGAGPLESLDGAMLLRTTRLRTVHIDPAARTARAEAGAVWQDVTVPAAEHGLAGLAGNSPNVGVARYTLGGGLGWLARHYGLAANSVTAAELVTPGGDLVRADADHESDLFWAVRGGGGIGVVTALEMGLYPVGDLYAGNLFFPIARAAEVLHAWRAWTGTVPDEVTSQGRLVRLPPAPQLPEPLRGRAFVKVEAACLGDAGTGAELTGPLRRLGPELDTFAAIPPPALGQLHMDPGQPVPFHGAGVFLSDFPAAAIDALAGLAG